MIGVSCDLLLDNCAPNTLLVTIFYRQLIPSDPDQPQHENNFLRKLQITRKLDNFICAMNTTSKLCIVIIITSSSIFHSSSFESISSLKLSQSFVNFCKSLVKLSLVRCDSSNWARNWAFCAINCSQLEKLTSVYEVFFKLNWFHLQLPFVIVTFAFETFIRLIAAVVSRFEVTWWINCGQTHWSCCGCRISCFGADWRQWRCSSS